MTNKITLRERIRALEVKVINLCQRLKEVCQKVADLESYVKDQFENHLKTIEEKEKEKRGYKHDWVIRIVVALIALFQALIFAWLVRGKR